MLFRLPEGVNDKERVFKILNHLRDDAMSDKNVLKIVRLGKKTDGTSRPLLIKLDNIAVKNQIIKRTFKLSFLVDQFGRIGISHDLTKEQRGELKILLDDAKMQEAANKDFLFKVRGSPGRWKIVRFPVISTLTLKGLTIHMPLG
ncbi:hypothetical protein HELRODRAFT_181959 [Helobdella robusta]|uniref:Uncharacterized protein n=1 Tax=Helobdella robusta TaxID=6412 RepID=T1FHI7_HELRO|nr:hypothetical protein HELRODRAFT_181959 [Helobdella robusta]ESN91903.1 hypothetical protein HELRODRAFT_181959 [Helobdella robusta]